MTASLFTVTPTPPTALKLELGTEGKFSFTITSLAAPDKVHELVIQALLVGGDGKGNEAGWLVAGPLRILSMAGGKTETVTITARPTNITQRGENTIKLVVADKDRPNDVYVDSPPVICEVIAPPVERKPHTNRPWWLLPAIVGGVLVLLGAGWAVWKIVVPFSKPALGKPCEPAKGCQEGLVCVLGAQKCLLAGGAACQSRRADQCASGECETSTEVCTIPLGGACSPGKSGSPPCLKNGACSPSTRTCLGNVGAPCKTETDCGTGRCADNICAIDASNRACGARGKPCCNGTCDLRASCDGTACIAADVWTSGADGLANFNGGTWTHPLLGSGGTLPAVNAVWGTTAAFVVGVGDNGLVVRRDGTRWHRDVAAGPDLTRTLFAVGGSGANDVWAVGTGPFRHYNGNSWVDVAAPSAPHFDLSFLAVWLSAPGEGWATGEMGVLARLHGGTWSFVSRQGNGFDKRGLWGSAENDVWKVGERHTNVGQFGEVDHFDGTAWKHVTTAADLASLSAVWGSDATHVWVVGDHGTVLFWDGTLWRPVLAGTADDLSAIWGSGPNDVWLAGTGGMRHFNGNTWSAIPGMTSPPRTVWLSRD